MKTNYWQTKFHQICQLVFEMLQFINTYFCVLFVKIIQILSNSLKFHSDVIKWLPMTTHVIPYTIKVFSEKTITFCELRTSDHENFTSKNVSFMADHSTIAWVVRKVLSTQTMFLLNYKSFLLQTFVVYGNIRNSLRT